MIGDIVTVMQKELREFFAPGGSRRGGLISLLIFVGIFGVFIPLELGRGFLNTFVALIYYPVSIPLSLVMGIIADAVAGERERHTLETLLASRLSDRSILFGKLGAAVVYSWVASVGTAVIAALVSNLKTRGGGFQFYQTSIFVTIVVGALLVSLFFGGIGVLLSLRAATVRQVQQLVGVAFIVIFLGPILIFSLLSPSAREQVVIWLTSANWAQVGLIVGAALLVIDVLLVGLALVRFQRAKLILS
jgi:ABC-2 type transport system permease protein